MSIQINDINAIDDDRNFSAAGIATVGSGASTITIDGSTSIVNVGTGITLSGSDGSISIAGTIYASSLNTPIEVSSFDPAIGSTSVGVSSNIIINFNQTVGFGTTGFFEIKTGLGTDGGTLVERLGISSSGLTVTTGGTKLVVNPTSTLEYDSSFYVTMSSGFITANGSDFAGINTVGTAQTYYFTSAPLALGDAYEGGYLICQSGGVRWVISPYASQVTRSWYLRGDSNTRAQEVSGCTGWFIPSAGQMQNPGFICRSYWDVVAAGNFGRYWSNTEQNSCYAWAIIFSNGCCQCTNKDSFDGQPARSFRCVTY